MTRLRLTAQDIPVFDEALIDLETAGNTLAGPWRRLLNAAADHPQRQDAQIAVISSILAGLPKIHADLIEAIETFGRHLFGDPSIDTDELEGLDVDTDPLGDHPPIDPLDLAAGVYPEDPNAHR